VHGVASRDRGGNQRLLDPVQLVQFALQRGDARRALSYRRVVRHALFPDRMLALVMGEVERKTGITK
jgi:hypothetical protein